ncbi:MAG TPA: fatty acid desaturase [Polyangiaceae bacterium]|nr:fatty acid desaturase [Polyangiaceae bacterium]
MSPGPTAPQERSPLRHIPTFFVLAVHAGAFFAPLVFTWHLLVAALASYVVQMFVITGGYHRYFSHRSYKTSRVFQFVLAWVGASTMQNGPLWWASWHRYHHRHADKPTDVHSPVLRGFRYAHIGWVMDGTHDRPPLDNIRDFTRYPELRFIDRFSWLPVAVFGAVTYLVGGLGALLWVFALATVASFHATLFINSLAHGPARRPRRYDTDDSSRNSLWLALLTLGEGWHNNHHRFMSVARQGFRWWEIDVTYYILRALSLVGVVRSLRQPPASARLAPRPATPRPALQPG